MKSISVAVVAAVAIGSGGVVAVEPKDAHEGDGHALEELCQLSVSKAAPHVHTPQQARALSGHIASTCLRLAASSISPGSELSAKDATTLVAVRQLAGEASAQGERRVLTSFCFALDGHLSAAMETGITAAHEAKLAGAKAKKNPYKGETRRQFCHRFVEKDALPRLAALRVAAADMTVDLPVVPLLDEEVVGQEEEEKLHSMMHSSTVHVTAKPKENKAKVVKAVKAQRVSVAPVPSQSAVAEATAVAEAVVAVARPKKGVSNQLHLVAAQPSFESHCERLADSLQDSQVSEDLVEASSPSISSSLAFNSEDQAAMATCASEMEAAGVVAAVHALEQAPELLQAVSSSDRVVAEAARVEARVEQVVQSAPQWASALCTDMAYAFTSFASGLAQQGALAVQKAARPAKFCTAYAHVLKNVKDQAVVVKHSSLAARKVVRTEVEHEKVAKVVAKAAHHEEAVPVLSEQAARQLQGSSFLRDALRMSKHNTAAALAALGSKASVVAKPHTSLTAVAVAVARKAAPQKPKQPKEPKEHSATDKENDGQDFWQFWQQ